MVKKRLLGEFANELCESPDFESSFRVYEKYLQRMEFEGAAYTCLPKNVLPAGSAIQPSRFIHTAPYPTNFLDHYVAEDEDWHLVPKTTLSKVINRD